MENDFTTICNSGCLSEDHKKEKVDSQSYNFPDEMGEFTPGAVEKVAVRADVLIQAKAL